MRKAFDGKIYDSNKPADYVTRWDNEKHHNKSELYEEELYRTDNHNWYLIVSGGKDSDHPGKEIIPLSNEDVFNWLEKRSEVLEEQYSYYLLLELKEA